MSDSQSSSGIAIDPAELWEEWLAETPKKYRTPQSAMAFAVDRLRRVAQQAPDPAIECWSIVEQLRAPEGAEVILLCDNPDFNGQPNNVIEICDDWTRWMQRRFTGDTMLDCLRVALRARTEDAAVKAQERRDEGR